MFLSRGSAPYRFSRSIYHSFRALVRTWRRLNAERLARAASLDYLASPGFKGLQIGCGPHHLKTWLNSDLLDNPRRDIFIDITRPLPLPDASLDAIYAGEVIEHIPEEHGRLFLREAFRVLKSGGTLRLTTPDLREICRLYLDINPIANIDQFGKVWKEGQYTRDRWTNSQFRSHGHQFIWSFESLAAAMREMGFESVLRCRARATFSESPELGQLEFHYGREEPDWVFARTIIVEATKNHATDPRRLKFMCGKQPTHPTRRAG